MIKKGLVLLVLVAVVTGGVFAQTDFADMPKNAVTVDIGPLIIGISVPRAMNAMLPDSIGEASGFGIAAQYERQLMEQFSVGFRFAYLDFGLSFSNSDTDDTVKTDTTFGLKFSSFSLEGHARWFPGDTFFLDGMLGFANLALNTSGKMELSESTSGQSGKEEMSETFNRGFFKIGIKIGWRIDFGKPGGFVFEPSLGYSFGLSASPTFSDQLTDYAKKKYGSDIDKDMMGSLDFPLLLLENYVFVGGPKLSLAFGWRF